MAVTYSEKLNFDDGIRLVAINDRGDCASIPSSDTTFPERIVAFINWFERAAEEFAKEEPPKQKMEEPLDLDAWEKWLEKRTAVCSKACDEIDGLFGKGVCENAFGVSVPDEHCILDFMEQMIPFINRAFSERGEKIALKYNRNRKGGRTQRNKAELIEDYRAEHGRNANGEPI